MVLNGVATTIPSVALRNYQTRSIPITIPQECRNDVCARCAVHIRHCATYPSTTWSGCGEVCNLFMSSFLRGASGADLSALPATYTVYGCTQRTSTSVENLSYMKGMFRSVPFSPPTPPDTRMLRSWSAPPRLSRRRRRVNGMEPVESARSAPALKLEPPR